MVVPLLPLRTGRDGVLALLKTMFKTIPKTIPTMIVLLNTVLSSMCDKD
jgi:hypothetical protein